MVWNPGDARGGHGVHPNAPAGGTGPGYSRRFPFAGISSGTGSLHGMVDPYSPLGLRQTAPATVANAATEPTIAFGPNANRAVVSAYTLDVLKAILRAAGEAKATISSTSRTPHDQARVMYGNLELDLAGQKKLYNGKPGEKVIATYEAAKKAKKSKNEIIATMEAKVKELGPSKVSRHCADPAVLGVIDVAPSSIKNKQAFIKAVSQEPRVAKFLKPPKDPAYHLEIPRARGGSKPAKPKASADTPFDPKVAPVQVPPAADSPQVAPVKDKTWIGIELVGDDGNPIANEKYRIKLPDGSTKEGVLDAQGRARVDGIDPGSCEVSFPNLDRREWTPA